MWSENNCTRKVGARFEERQISTILLQQMDFISRSVALVQPEKRLNQPLVPTRVEGVYDKHNLAVLSVGTPVCMKTESSKLMMERN